MLPGGATTLIIMTFSTTRLSMTFSKTRLSILLSIVMLSVIMLSVAAPYQTHPNIHFYFVFYQRAIL